MEIVQSLKDFQMKGNGCWITIGKWDGIHLGHQRILKELVANARRNGGQSVVISFDRHPAALFRPTSVPYQLQTVIERSTVLGELGVDVHLVIPFTTQFASLSPTQFVEDILINGLHASEIMVGYNFRFGRGQQGTIELLKEICFSFDVAVKVFSPVIIDGEVVSSTKIRHYLERGEVERVKKFLGRPPVIFGQIMRGTKITKKGECTFPLVVDRAKQVPASGEYEVK
ncbi:MAG: hypothetical protein APF81_01520 [Desulfosporosinus sp. BRH_c37]|nr:MAG: hypothetical protein APF81_01520 [Desulfosporosinus sp. BRH_c37]